MQGLPKHRGRDARPLRPWTDEFRIGRSTQRPTQGPMQRSMRHRSDPDGRAQATRRHESDDSRRQAYEERKRLLRERLEQTRSMLERARRDQLIPYAKVIEISRQMDDLVLEYTHLMLNARGELEDD